MSGEQQKRSRIISDIHFAVTDPKIQKTPEVEKMNYTVVNGEEMAAYFQVNRPECTDIIPFNGQMDIGSPKEDLLSGMFIVERLSAWHTTITNYQDKILKYLDAFREPEGNTYHLYFEDSARSYANILTILAYLGPARATASRWR